MANSIVVADGVGNIGKIKFSLKNKQIFDLAVKAFNKYSDYKNNAVNLNYFLQALQITSSLEGGFDAINTYDKAGISVGFLQFARPSDNVYNLLSIYDMTLANKVKAAFGSVDPHIDTKSLKSRIDKDLLTEIQKSIVTPDGIEAQFKLCIENYYDYAYKKFLTLKFSSEVDNSQFGVSSTVNKSLGMGLNNQNVFNNSLSKQSTDFNQYKIYANAFIFDIGVNQGISRIDGKGKDRVNQVSIGGIPMTEGNFINYHVNHIYLLPQRKEFWKKIITENFYVGNITT